MKVLLTFIGAALLSCDTGTAFQHSTIGHGTKTTKSTSTSLNGYIPDGFTKESYAKFKKEEAAKKAKKNLGRMGPKGFKSRSFQSFQEALERGEAEHLLPVMNAKERYAFFFFILCIRINHVIIYNLLFST